MSTAQIRPAAAVLRRRALPQIGSLPLACGALTLAIGLALYLFGPPGVDRAAHVYHTGEFAEHGWRVWNNYWYAGRYELLNYSVLFYPLASVLGLGPVVIGGLVAGSATFASLIRTVAGAPGRWAAVVFAVWWPVTLVAGQYPFTLGAAFAIAALLALLQHHPLAALALTALAALSSPLVLLLVSVVLAGLAAGAGRSWLARPRARLAATGLLALLGAEVLVLRMFPVEGRFPFGTPELAWLLLFAVGGAVVARSVPLLRGVFIAYGVAALLVYSFPSGVGGNFERLADYWAAALFVLAYAVRPQGWRRSAIIVLGLAVIVQAVPVARTVSGGLQERADRASFWRPAISFLNQNADPDHRVEVVSTWGHWESYHLARQRIPLTRGWFRQDDFPINLPLYDGALEPESYRRWLSALAVRYIVVPRDELDYSSRKEAEILALGPRQLPFLRTAHRDAHTTIYEVVDPTPLLTLASQPGLAPVVTDAPGVIRLDDTSLALWLPRAGHYDLRVRYTPFWRTSEPAAICVAPGTNGMTRLASTRGGPVTLSFDLTLARSASQAIGASPPRCTAPPAGARSSLLR